MKRYAIVRNADDRRQAEAYLPDNYSIMAELVEREQRFSCVAPEGVEAKDKLVFVIEGVDYAGWTLDGYVVPRFASGLIWAEEIGLDHEVMKAIPLEQRKPHVHVEQDRYLDVIDEVGGEALLEDIAQFFDVSETTARRNLDGLVAQGKLDKIGRSYVLSSAVIDSGERGSG